MKSFSLLYISLWVILYPLLNLLFFNLPLNNFLTVPLFYLFFLVYSFLLFPLTQNQFQRFSLKGWGFSRGLTIVFLILLYWPLSLILKNNSLIFLTLALLPGFIFWWKKPAKPIIENHINNIIRGEIILTLVFFLFLVIRAFHPEVETGEKPMDFGLLKYFYRNKDIMIEDHWAAGTSLNYYFFGLHLYAKVSQFLSIPISIAYNLVLSFLPALIVVITFDLIGRFTNSTLVRYFFSLSAVFSSNLAAILIYIQNKGETSFAYFWKTARVFVRKGNVMYFSEHPHWSFVFSDLHPHVIAFPIVFLSLGLIVNVIDKKFSKLSLVLLSAAIGTFLTTNIWDFVSLVGLVIVLFTFSLKEKKSYKLLFIPLLAGALFSIHYLMIKGGRSIIWGLVTRDFNNIHHVLMHIGQWLIPLVAFLLAFLVIKRDRVNLAVIKDLKFLYVLFPIIIGSLVSFQIVDNSFWPRLVFNAISIFLICLFFQVGIKNNLKKIIALFVVYSFLVMSVIDQFYLMDHYNTLFKFYNFIYIALFMVTGFIWCYFKRLGFKYTNKIFVTLFSCLIISGVFNLFSFKSRLNVRQLYHKGIDSFQTIKNTHPEDIKAITWLNDNIEGTPVIIEHVGKSYDRSGRFSIYTGLPSFLVWPNHIIVRGKSYVEKNRRHRIIDEIYLSPNIAVSHKLMKDNGIDLIIVGGQEKRKYSKVSLQKFKAGTNYFDKIYRDSSVSIYKRKDAIINYR